MLNIAHFHSRYYLAQSSPDPSQAQVRLDQLVRERLPQLVAALLPVDPADQHAVYCIRRLHLSLWLDALGMQEHEAAERWARLLAQAVVRAILYGPSQDVVRYDDAAHFLAAFLVDLMAGQAWSRWMYRQFRPLEGVPVGRAAALALAARAELLLPVAGRLSRQGQLERLLGAMEASDLELIWDRGLGFAGAARREWTVEAAERALGALPPLSLETGSPASFARNRMRLYLLAGLTRPELAGDETTAALAHHVARLHQALAARPATWLWEALAAGEIDSPAALGPWLETLNGPLAEARLWLIETLSAPDGAARLGRLVRTLIPQAEQAGAKETGKARQAADRVKIATAFAGLGLLLPSIRELSLFELAGREGIYQLLLDAVGPAYQPLAISDPAPAWLAGIQPLEIEAARRAVVDWDPVLEQPAAGAVSAADGETPYLPATRLVLEHFAAGLRGLSGSSPEYLVKQFIRLPGSLALSEQELEVHLSQAPLAVLLQMGGHTGEQGTLPWLAGRLLSIHLPV